MTRTFVGLFYLSGCSLAKALLKNANGTGTQELMARASENCSDAFSTKDSRSATPSVNASSTWRPRPFCVLVLLQCNDSKGARMTGTQDASGDGQFVDT